MKSIHEVEALMDKYAARNYHPLAINIVAGQGAWIWTDESRSNENKYLDCLAAYSALNHGYNHPRLLAAALMQLSTGVTVTSRAFLSAPMAELCKLISELCAKEKTLLMNTGAEAVESAIKLARKWGYKKKNVEADKAKIIVCHNNFHGRTIAVVGFSSESQYRDGFGPFPPGFRIINYGSLDELEAMIDSNTVGFLVEPIQGEAGIIIPPDGFLAGARQICKQNNVLFIADCIQSGLGRTGKLFACDWEQVVPDIYILGKALGGGFPASAVVANGDIMDVLTPGDHGSTFGGNPFCAAVAIEAIKVIVDEDLPGRSLELGTYFLNKLKKIKSKHVREYRGRGLWIAIELHDSAGGARRFCEALADEYILCKETHKNVIRIAPPLVISKSDIDWALPKFEKVLLSD
ncbi:ornithine--oxo-acid transaminase [candidate division KSB1 bacterium]|nr:ornithine--oxo-acid transaminase [candidate division KSB1 bacterium]